MVARPPKSCATPSPPAAIIARGVMPHSGMAAASNHARACSGVAKTAASTTRRGAQARLHRCGKLSGVHVVPLAPREIEGAMAWLRRVQLSDRRLTDGRSSRPLSLQNLDGAPTAFVDANRTTLPQMHFAPGLRVGVAVRVRVIRRY